MGRFAAKDDDRPQAGEGDDSRALMERAKSGDRAAFDILVRNYANMVIGLAWKVLGSHDDALDCAQDAFVKAWENAERYDPKWSVATWLRRIVTNLALDRLRRRRPIADFGESIGDVMPAQTERPDAAAERQERARAVHNALAFLPEKYRMVLVLRDMEGVEIPDIAEITGSNVATVRWRLHRARGLFKDRWSAVWNEE